MNVFVLTTTFSDMFKKSFLNNFAQESSPAQFLLTLAMALLIGLGIYFVYRRCYIGVVYDHSFNVSLVVMTILVAVIIVTISSNITLSLGMVGALSIVRYRTAVKSPMDLMFLFWAITTGIAVGANYFFIAGGAFVFVAITFFALKTLRGDDRTYMLVINLKTDLKVEEGVRRELEKLKYKLRSKVVKADRTEITAEVRVKRDNINITDAIAGIEGVENVTLVQYRGTYEA
ncbi:MAG: DUF4956 domain-containing protein [Lachnospiraceae bacterium]|nr:DUF4956 domain-containing protein [Lachnospiraceae bacterium]